MVAGRPNFPAPSYSILNGANNGIVVEKGAHGAETVLLDFLVGNTLGAVCLRMVLSSHKYETRAAEYVEIFGVDFSWCGIGVSI